MKLTPRGEDASVPPRFLAPLMFESMQEAASDEFEDVEIGDNDSGLAMLLLCVAMETSLNEFDDFERAIVTVSVSSLMFSFMSSPVTSIRGPAYVKITLLKFKVHKSNSMIIRSTLR